MTGKNQNRHKKSVSGGCFANHIARLVRGTLLVIATGLLIIMSMPEPGNACGSNCNEKEHEKLQEMMQDYTDDVKARISRQFRAYQTWFMNEFFDNFIAPSIVLMAEQLTTLSYWQMFTLGTFFDAQQQLETQRVFHELAAEAHKKYRPSEEMCRVGTLARGMKAAERSGDIAAVGMAASSRNRQLAYEGSISSEGTASDRTTRVESFVNLYCDPGHNGGGFATVCNGGGPPDRINNDMNFTKTVGNPLTLDVDFTDTTLTEDEEDIIALNRNLFAHKLFMSVTRNVLQASQNQSSYLDARSIVAKRSVIENSFFALVGLKSAGSTEANSPATPTSGQGSGFYVINMLSQLGMTQDEATALVGERPSYYALLDIMAHKSFANPRFFSNLYVSPANVKRSMVAMQATDLMLGREAYKSELRTENLLSLWLELDVNRYQRGVTNRLEAVREVKE